ncbi:Golgi complex component 7-domain-containing protein [Crassisporium funariophilum]|nr:Golgi complex component 7-domain-containing protein [Crassisporium funariophilum]
MALPTSTVQLVDSLDQYDDVVSWINDTLTPKDSDDPSSTLVVDLTELDHQITQLLTTLDIALEDTSSQLERIIDDVSRGIPRLAYDLHFMKDGASTLQHALVGVLQRSRDAVPDETSAALDSLHHLDTIKGRMESSREVLREAESWSTLEHEVTSLIAEKSYGKAAERLSEANKSMVVFQNTPEYDPRRTLMVNLQNQLEAALSTALLSAINAQDITACREYFTIFSIIQRESEFRNYYYASRRSSIVSLWQTSSLVDCSPTPSAARDSAAQGFADFLSKFYNNFLSLLNTERTSVCSIFPDPSITLSQFISSTFSSLQPTFPQRLIAYSSHHGELTLSHLIIALRATEEFATGVEKIMEKVKYTTSPILSPRQVLPEKVPTHVRRRSSRMSISWRPGQPHRNSSSSAGITKANVESTEGMEWDQELFQPFLHFQVDYGSLERRFLEQSLCEIITSDTREKVQAIDRPRLFRERAVDIFGVAEGSMGRCKAFTHGYGSVGLVQALDGFFQSFIDMWTADVQTESQNPSSLLKHSLSDSELSDLDYTAQDWSDIQLSLHLLASARTVFDRLTTFETKMRTYLSQLAAHFRLALNDPSNFLIAVTKGESQLLEQSTLNSAELHALLISAENDANSRDPPFSATLRHQAPMPIPTPEPLLVNSRQALSTFAQTCQMSTTNTILSPLRNHLAGYAASPAWRVSGDPNLVTSSNDLQVPTFSLSPSDTVQRVAEGLLNLPRLFEVYADDDALAFSLQTLPYVESEVLQNLSEQSHDVPAQQAHRRRPSINYTKPSTIDPEVVSSAWLISLGHTFLEYLTTVVLPAIPTLSVAGAAQLASDLGYLSNIVQALNVEHTTLEKWRIYVTMNQDEGVKALNENKSGLGILDPVLEHIAKLRGWC